jgi:hypothetical protein
VFISSAVKNSHTIARFESQNFAQVLSFISGK